MKSALFDDGLKAQHAALKQRETNTSLIWEPTPVARKPAPIVTIAIEAELIALIETATIARSANSMRCSNGFRISRRMR